jgi:hypothetical protein
MRFPFMPAHSLVNRMMLKAFNTFYYYRQQARIKRDIQHNTPFFYPLDAIQEWNRMYGPRGFYQYQCVIPPRHAEAATGELLAAIAASGQGSFLTVLKTFGARPSPGLLSFPRAGVTLAVDFPNLGEKTLRLFERLDAIVRTANGRLYPAKDGRQPGALFRQGYPTWQNFVPFIDPVMSSSFWRRVMAGEID